MEQGILSTRQQDNIATNRGIMRRPSDDNQSEQSIQTDEDSMMKTFAIYVGVDETTTPQDVVKSVQEFLVLLGQRETLPEEEDLTYEAYDCQYPGVISRLED